MSSAQVLVRVGRVLDDLDAEAAKLAGRRLSYDNAQDLVNYVWAAALRHALDAARAALVDEEAPR